MQISSSSKDLHQFLPHKYTNISQHATTVHTSSSPAIAFDVGLLPSPELNLLLPVTVTVVLEEQTYYKTLKVLSLGKRDALPMLSN